MSQLDEIVRSQADLYGRIARAYENLKKLGAAQITRGVIEARLQALENNWSRFEANNEKLLAFPPEDIANQDYYKQDIPSQAEEAYLQQKSIFLDLLHSLNDTPASSGAPVTNTSSVTSTASAPRTTLPRIQLPQFSGRYEDWPAFRDLFSSIFSRDFTTSPVERLHYLKTCLKGEAELLVKNLSTTNENFECAWKTLCGYYDNKRLLVRANLSKFVSFPKLKTESAADLRKLFHCLRSTVSSMASIGRPFSSCDDLLVHLAVELLDQRTRREWETSISESIDPPSYDNLEGFLDRRLHALEALLPVKLDDNTKCSGIDSSKSARAHHARKQENKPDAKRGRCFLCQQEHFIMLCQDYKGKSAQERKTIVEKNHLCYNCLGRHQVSDCASKKVCSVCSSRHHSSLHDAYRESESGKSSHVARKGSEEPVAVLLATARVRVRDCWDNLIDVRALVDQGSETSILSERLAQKLRLPRVSSASVAVYGVGGVKTAVARGRVILSILPRFPGSSMTVSAIILPRLTVYSGGHSTDVRAWPHLRDLTLADSEFGNADPVDILLGADVYASILLPGLCKGDDRQPVAQNSTLGWLLSGAFDPVSTNRRLHSHQCRLEDNLSWMVRRFWEQEEIPMSLPALSKEERECEEHFAQTHSRLPDGRYMVRLPVISPLPDFSETHRLAERMLRHMERKFKRDTPLFHERYVEFLQQYLNLGHMSEVSFTDDTGGRSDCCYLPHHGVLREASTSTKLRVVFNGSAKLSTGESLNRHLQVGPNLLPSLSDLLLQWRRHRFVLITDVEKMYRQIMVHPQDRDLQRILWRETSGQAVKKYQLNTVTYGLACAPFLAIRTLKQLANDEEQNFPLGAEVLRHEVYMDDILSGASTLKAAKELVRQLLQLCKAGGFPLKKWSANAAAVLEDLPLEDRLQQESRWWRAGEGHSALGLQWHPLDDCFAFTVKLPPLEVVSKRSTLSFAAKIFDPLGWLSPTTIRAKILIQSSWLLGVDWDTPLPDDDAHQWREYHTEMAYLEEIRVPRWLASGDESVQEIHGFADASERAYAAVIYLRSGNQEASVKVSLITAKTKVAPLKQVSLPRLELCAATLLVRLTAHIRRILRLEAIPLHLWTDSTVTLGWIRGHPATWKTFVANRVSEIQTLLPDAHWHHVAGVDNPADCASRGISSKDLVHHSLWWYGPPWLKFTPDKWTETLSSSDSTVELPERRFRSVLVTRSMPEDVTHFPIARFSSLNRLLRVTAWCRRWLLRHSAVSQDLYPPQVIQAVELDEARRRLIMIVQNSNFKLELNALKKKLVLPTRSVLLKLSPYLDDQGLLRVGGRLKHSILSEDEKHPVILPSDSPFTYLVIEAAHRRTLHGGVQLTLSTVRQEFWVPRGRALVKRCIHRCTACLRWRAASPQPFMGVLPAPRVTPTHPFLNTGVDYAGPFWLRCSKGRGQRATKAFVVVFVCLSTKAVHLDVSSDYSADAFLAALRRFVSRRGLCQTLYSDCGTNFIGADSQLRTLFSASSPDGQRIATYVANDRIRWCFNPPAAPNFGGIWEAVVKSMKHHLRRVLGDAKLTYEEMATLLAQIEACLNSRPLQAISDDPEDLDALTPGHFLIGSALNAIPEPFLNKEPLRHHSRWKLLQAMRDHFWDRWAKEYLHTLAHRPKWTKSNEDIRKGRLCLLRNETTPPNKWPLVRVVKLYPGKDGHVRVVDVRTATSTYKRPVNKLILLPDWSTPADIN